MPNLRGSKFFTYHFSFFTFHFYLLPYLTVHGQSYLNVSRRRSESHR